MATLNEKTLKDIVDTVATAYPLVIPDKEVSYPCIVYKMISRNPKITMQKEIYFQQSRYQLDVYGKTYKNVKDTVKTLTSALLQNENTIFVQNSFDSMDEDTNPKLYRVTLDVFMYEIEG